jgi:hypothetical protein
VSLQSFSFFLVLTSPPARLQSDNSMMRRIGFPGFPRALAQGNYLFSETQIGGQNLHEQVGGLGAWL